MRWVVDGMNVIGSRPDRWWEDRPGAMRALVERLTAFAVERGEPVTVVFDGGPFDLGRAAPDAAASPAGAASPGTVDVRFASRRGRDAADDDIAALVAADPEPATLRVVTSDARLAGRVRAHGAHVEGAGTFRARL